MRIECDCCHHTTFTIIRMVPIKQLGIALFEATRELGWRFVPAGTTFIHICPGCVNYGALDNVQRVLTTQTH